jgi:PEP-CTERM motif
MRKTLGPFVLLLTVVMFSVAAMASPASVPLGYISYNLTDPGLAQFFVLNQTGPNSSPFPDPTWPISTTVNLSSLSLTLTDMGGGTTTFGSGFFSLELDGLSFDGPIVSSTNTYVMAVLTGTLSPTTFTLNDGSTFNALPTFSATITDSAGLMDGDFAIIDANSSVVVPEPGTLAMVGSGLLGLLGFARRRFLR